MAPPPRLRRRLSALLCGRDRQFRVEKIPDTAAVETGLAGDDTPLVIIPGAETPTLRCSRTACTEEPEWKVVWRNPRIHGPERQKLWLACEEHRQYFEAYLSQKGFPVASVRREAEEA